MSDPKMAEAFHATLHHGMPPLYWLRTAGSKPVGAAARGRFARRLERDPVFRRYVAAAVRRKADAVGSGEYGDHPEIDLAGWVSELTALADELEGLDGAAQG